MIEDWEALNQYSPDYYVAFVGDRDGYRIDATV